MEFKFVDIIKFDTSIFVLRCLLESKKCSDSVYLIVNEDIRIVCYPKSKINMIYTKREDYDMSDEYRENMKIEIKEVIKNKYLKIQKHRPLR